MHKLIRFYYRNRLKVWGVILGVIFIIAIIQVMNNLASDKLEEENNISLFHHKTPSSEMLLFTYEEKSSISLLISILHQCCLKH